MTEIAADQALPGVSALPLCYTSLTPLVAQQHGALCYERKPNFSFAANINAVPLVAAEFPKAISFYPVVFTRAEPFLPVALLGPENGKNEFLANDGSWREGAYIPAYLRRYPFALASEKQGSERMLLCADLKAEGFSEGTSGQLFEDSEPSAHAKQILDFCSRFETAMQNTRAMVRELSDLDLLEESAVNISRGEQTFRINGFRVVSEQKMRDLDDEKLASLTRRGIVGMVTAHLFSTQRFSDLIQDL
jgi:hypothetical protein